MTVRHNRFVSLHPSVRRFCICVCVCVSLRLRMPVFLSKSTDPLTRPRESPEIFSKTVPELSYFLTYFLILIKQVNVRVCLFPAAWEQLRITLGVIFNDDKTCHHFSKHEIVLADNRRLKLHTKRQSHTITPRHTDKLSDTQTENFSVTHITTHKERETFKKIHIFSTYTQSHRHTWI